jgi:hypothetical protein
MSTAYERFLKREAERNQQAERPKGEYDTLLNRRRSENYVIRRCIAELDDVKFEDIWNFGTVEECQQRLRNLLK